MFKKSLAAVAVLGAFAASSMAADVQLYGVVDYGMIYTNSVEKTEGKPDSNVDKFELNSGVNSGSRLGIKATEDLGNGYKVSFKLENGFEADDGEMSDNRLFGREASLSVSSSWGTLSAGRMGAISAAAGTYDFMALVDAFDGGDGDINGLVGTARMDNMLVYQSPKFAGLQMTAEYSFKNDNKADPDVGHEGHTDANRYAGFALTGEYGNFQAMAAYEQILKSDTVERGAENADAKIVTVGGNYNCGFATTFVSGQYFENIDNKTDGYALHVGAQIPVAAGTLTTGLYYNDKDNGADDSDYIGGSVKYEYPLSARTLVYSSIGYAEEDAGKTTTETTQAYFGLTHTF